MRPAAATLAAIAASAAGFALSTGLGEHGWLAWVAPVPVLAIAIDDRARTAFLAPFLAALLGGLGLAQAYGPLAAVLAVQLRGPAVEFDSPRRHQRATQGDPLLSSKLARTVTR